MQKATSKSDYFFNELKNGYDDNINKKGRNSHITALKLEERAAEIRSYLTNYNESLDYKEKIKQLIEDIEDWKLEFLYDNNSKKKFYAKDKKNDSIICQSLFDAIKYLDQEESFSSDRNALLSVMRMHGFGRSNREARKASAVLRFLHPRKWGVIDWRNAAIIDLYQKYDFDEEKIITEIMNGKNLREKTYTFLGVYAAIGYNMVYREMRDQFKIGRCYAADIDLAIYGLSRSKF